MHPEEPVSTVAQDKLYVQGRAMPFILDKAQLHAPNLVVNMNSEVEGQIPIETGDEKSRNDTWRTAKQAIGLRIHTLRKIATRSLTDHFVFAACGSPPSLATALSPKGRAYLWREFSRFPVSYRQPGGEFLFPLDNVHRHCIRKLASLFRTPRPRLAGMGVLTQRRTFVRRGNMVLVGCLC